jgi:hypothetical protein
MIASNENGVKRAKVPFQSLPYKLREKAAEITVRIGQACARVFPNDKTYEASTVERAQSQDGTLLGALVDFRNLYVGVPCGYTTRRLGSALRWLCGTEVAPGRVLHEAPKNSVGGSSVFVIRAAEPKKLVQIDGPANRISSNGNGHGHAPTSDADAAIRKLVQAMTEANEAQTVRIEAALAQLGTRLLDCMERAWGPHKK